MITEAALLRKYGPILTLDQVGEVLHYAPGTLENMRAQDKSPVPLKKRGAKWITTAAALARYIDAIDAELASGKSPPA